MRTRREGVGTYNGMANWTTIIPVGTTCKTHILLGYNALIRRNAHVNIPPVPFDDGIWLFMYL